MAISNALYRGGGSEYHTKHKIGLTLIVGHGRVQGVSVNEC